METIVTSGVREQIAAFDEVEKETRLWGETDIEQRAGRILEAAKRRVRVSPGAGVGGVHLRDGLGVGKLKHRGFDSYVEVGALREVLTLPDGRATFEEYGTKNQQAYPFLRPSVDEEFA